MSRGDEQRREGKPHCHVPLEAELVAVAGQDRFTGYFGEDGAVVEVLREEFGG